MHIRIGGIDGACAGDCGNSHGPLGRGMDVRTARGDRQYVDGRSGRQDTRAEFPGDGIVGEVSGGMQ